MIISLESTASCTFVAYIIVVSTLQRWKQFFVVVDTKLQTMVNAPQTLFQLQNWPL